MKQTLFTAEWKEIFRNKKLLIPIIAVMMIPILYSGMFLWAFWDPYDKLEDLPVAVVNNDKGSDFEGEELRLGYELVNKLKDNDQFSFQVVTKKEGYQGLEAQKYYMLIEIPENFSENATTLMDENPKKLELNYVPNEGYNFLSAQIGETAAKEIRAAVSKEVTATYAETMFDKVKEMADGFEQASEGASELHEGTVKINEGSHRLKESLGLLASKSIEFQDGVSQIQSGTGELASGTEKLANGLDQLAEGHKQLVNGAKAATHGSEKLAAGSKNMKEGLQQAESSMDTIISGTDQIHDGTGQLAEKLKQFQAGTDSVSQGANQLNAGIVQMKEQLNGIDAKLAALPIPDELKAQLGKEIKGQLQEGISQLESGSAELAAGTDQLKTSAGELQKGAAIISDKVGQLNDGQKQLKSGLGELASGSDDLLKGANELAGGQGELLKGMSTFDEKLNEAKSGAAELNSGAKQVYGGMNSLSAGSSQLGEGSRQLAEGSNELANGTQKLDDGAADMKEKLGDAAKQAGSVHADDRTYDMMGEPVEVENHPMNKVPNYGTGFAPYFLSLGLFVGALLLSIVFPLREPAGRPKNGVSWFMGKFGVIAIVGVLQSLLAVVVMLFGLGIEVKSVLLFILTTIITSLAFVALIQFLVTLLGDPGRFIAIVILILQLTTSAGTFPLELIPHELQWFNAFLPMTYSVQAYKAVISSGDFSFMWHNLGILFGFLVSFMALTLGFFIYKHKRQYAVGHTAEEA
ncbi:YhgE/Pip domain-containing protein [Siminovitchia acidinfaciens]|uniref:YhgE/Pip domain-containing protein n=1 Tax=Siminovitchia acidinfaciens TaxID=2321395 RepID=A0A429Y1U7_9BACI|nr:YhgE/Pip domain-containing protein [Siminovitchia acidinfaciens]RST75180.1 YhgE/Pip domain-containing protein [Siminovitchia acidinfaciens]